MSERVKIIGICGGSGSGKSTVVARISSMIDRFALIPQDAYYKDIIPPVDPEVRHLKYNFDHPDQFDSDKLYQDLLALRASQPIEMPIYDFVASRRQEQTISVKPAKLIIVEGILIFADERIRELLDLKLYIETPSDIRLIRRLERDIKERGRSLDSVIEQYLLAVRPGHFQFVEPMKVYADLIIPEGGHNEKALEVLSSFLKLLL